MTDETRARFLAAIAAQVPIERIAEVHLFPAIRQGGMESGVAVIAVERAGEHATEAAVDDERAEAPAVEAVADEGTVEAELDADAIDADSIEDDDPSPRDAAEEDAEPTPRRRAPQRYTVYSARYRHTLKGPERGRWEVAVTEEADAPLLTVDAVVRGVQRRSGDADEIVRLSGDEVRATLPVTAAS